MSKRTRRSFGRAVGTILTTAVTLSSIAAAETGDGANEEQTSDKKVFAASGIPWFWSALHGGGGNERKNPEQNRSNPTHTRTP